MVALYVAGYRRLAKNEEPVCRFSQSESSEGDSDSLGSKLSKTSIPIDDQCPLTGDTDREYRNPRPATGNSNQL